MVVIQGKKLERFVKAYIYIERERERDTESARAHSHFVVGSPSPSLSHLYFLKGEGFIPRETEKNNNEQR